MMSAIAPPSPGVAVAVGVAPGAAVAVGPGVAVAVGLAAGAFAPPRRVAGASAFGWRLAVRAGPLRVSRPEFGQTALRWGKFSVAMIVFRTGLTSFALSR